MTYVSLLAETIKAIESTDYTIGDVQWVGSKDGEFAITWEQFATIANVEYDNGYGGAEIAHDLVIVGDSWWLERHEYDGSEWWEYKMLPQQQLHVKSIHKVIGDGNSVKDMNP